MAVTALKPKTAVESLRDIVQDLLVPELKALKVEVEGVRTELRSSVNGLHTEMDGLRTEMRLRDENRTRAIGSLAEESAFVTRNRQNLSRTSQTSSPRLYKASPINRRRHYRT